ncbi:MAG: HNH endonuclease [Selenomonadaceae bacterium]|nr:HNH endonuclease [Selenomonadaceae bacterium]
MAKMQSEIWKEIPGYNGCYLISKTGKVYSRKIGREMKQIDRGNGYLFVRLCNGGKTKNVMIHRLVAFAFVPNPCGYVEIDHIDGNKKNNNCENLHFVSHVDNMRNPNTKNKRYDAIKKKQGIPVIALLNGNIVGKYSCLMDAARDLGLSCSHIAKHLKGYFTHVKGYQFKQEC